MPIYEFQCQNCGKRTELLQRFEDPPLAACPECGGEVKKLFSAPAVQFKGSGWYVTDYAGKKGTGESKSDTPSESKSESKADTKAKEGGTDSKPAASAAKSSSGSE
jgi:putative FmdB family regulatory protein